MKSNITDEQASILYYLIEKLVISHKNFIDWAYTQYQNDGVLPWIESAVLTMSLREVKSILAQEFCISFESISTFVVGKMAHDLDMGLTSEYKVINDLIYYIEYDWSAEEKKQLYIMDDYYDWHQAPNSVVRPLLDKFLKDYRLIYQQYMDALFCQQHQDFQS